MYRIPLKRVALIEAGQSPPSSEVEPLTSGKPFLQGNAEFGSKYPLARFECESAHKSCISGDILLSVRAPVGALNIADQNYGIGRGLCAIRVKSCDQRFLWWWLHHQVPALNAVATGSTYTAVTTEEVGRLSFPVFPIEEQWRIADFLDIEMSRIELIVGKLCRLKELLQARRWSVFDQLLSQLDVRFLPIRRLLRSITDGPFGSAFLSSDYSDSGAAVVRLGNIGFNEYCSADQARIPLTIYRKFLRHRVRPGDLLIAGLGDANNHAGRACVAPDLGPAMVKGKCFSARVDAGMAVASYLALLLSSPVGEQAFVSRGSTRSMINLELVKSAVVPVPSISDQGNLLQGFNSASSTAQGALEMIDRQSSLLVERRQALITAAVTGQIDVTTARGAES